MMELHKSDRAQAVEVRLTKLTFMYLLMPGQNHVHCVAIAASWLETIRMLRVKRSLE